MDGAIHFSVGLATVSLPFVGCSLPYRSKFPNDGLFAYNAACVYGRSAEAIAKDDKAADRDKKQADYKRLAIDDLRASLKFGFNDLEWMKKDPDLNSLHDMPEFKELAK